MSRRATVAALTLMLFAANALAQDSVEADKAALAQKIQNPLASVISLPMQSVAGNTAPGGRRRLPGPVPAQPLVPPVIGSYLQLPSQARPQ